MPTAVVGVIPTFRPDQAVIPRIDMVCSQVDHVLVSDDASPCSADPVLRAISAAPDVTLLRHSHNRGIARGLNEGLALAINRGATWLLTVDQDTDLEAGYVTTLLTEAEHRAGTRIGAIGAEVICDESGILRYPAHVDAHGHVTEEVIQTGTLWSVAALIAVGGFDESLGIDAVDAAACLRLRERDYSICLATGTSLHHSIGSARIVHFLGRATMVTGHSPERRTTMLRNRLRLFPAEFRQSPRHALRTLRRVVINQSLGLALESDRWAKARGSARGLRPHSPRGDQ